MPAPWLCEFIVYTCPDPSAGNFRYIAGSTPRADMCEYAGCNDTLAANHNPIATFNDGSCVLPKSGCTDTRSINYVADAVLDDGSCQIMGCTDSTRLNYDPAATVDDASCIRLLPACLDASAANGRAPEFGVYYSEPSLCIHLGCTDSMGTNFNPSAVAGVMCKGTVSVRWDGALYDCDFNQQLALPLQGAPTIFDVESLDEVTGRRVATDNHCFGCTAGAGSSCGGATA